MTSTQTRVAALSLALVAGLSASAQAAMVNATITADNHYALYSSTGAVFSYHGGNELGASGNPGQYNWSLPETYSFEAGDFIYIAAWSDDAVAQGVLANIMADNVNLSSGSPLWQVTSVGVNLGTGSPHPTALDIAARVANADANNLWETPYVGGANGIAPWGSVPGIGQNARWMWRANGESNTLIGGANHGEYLIFRTVVPAPGALALAGMGGLLVARRRR
jgi:hypothetical protein